MASLSRNHADRNRHTSFSLLARMTVLPRLHQACPTYARAVLAVPPCGACIGGPGRGRSQKKQGMVKRSHQAPTRKRARRKEKVDPPVSLTRITVMIWTITAAI